MQSIRTLRGSRPARGAVGLGTLARSIDEWGGIRAVERLNLDGLLALWHPASKN